MPIAGDAAPSARQPSKSTRTVSDRRKPKAASLPLVGSLPWMLHRPVQFLEESMARHGGVFELDLGVTRVVIVADLAAVEHVLLGNARNYDKGGPFWDAIRDVLGQGLGTSEGALWRRQRKLMQPTFQPSFLERFRRTIAETVEEDDEFSPRDVAGAPPESDAFLVADRAA